MNPCLVVISHYNAWPTDQLLALLDQMKSIPAGHPFQCRVVVNQAEPKPLELPPRHADVETLYRANTGHNIGAWDHGWRQLPAFDDYMFLQEECQILRANWVGAFVERAADPWVGLVGESLEWADLPWDQLDWGHQHVPFAFPIAGQQVSYPRGLELCLAQRGVDPGPTGDHLQSLVWCTRRAVLEAIDGFTIGINYTEAVVAEVAASKQVQALGLQTCQVSAAPFHYILHPQWAWKSGAVAPTQGDRF